MEKEQTNIMEYDYAPDQIVTLELKGHQLYGLIELLDYVIEDNSYKDIYLDGYPTTAEPVTVELEDGKKVIDRVEVEWKTHPNLNSFFSQKVTSGVSQIGARAIDLNLVLKRIHEQMVLDGTAKKQTDL